MHFFFVKALNCKNWEKWWMRCEIINICTFLKLQQIWQVLNKAGERFRCFKFRLPVLPDKQYRKDEESFGIWNSKLLLPNLY